MRNEIADEIMYGAIGLVEKTAPKLLHFILRIYLRDSSPHRHNAMADYNNFCDVIPL